MQIVPWCHMSSALEPRVRHDAVEQYLYAMRSSAGFIKIGVSKNPVKRRRSLTYNTNHTVQIVATLGPFLGATILERAVHSALAEHREFGEWFSCSDTEALSAIREAIGKFNEPVRRPDPGPADLKKLFQALSHPAASHQAEPEWDLHKFWKKHTEAELSKCITLADRYRLMHVFRQTEAYCRSQGEILAPRPKRVLRAPRREQQQFSLLE